MSATVPLTAPARRWSAGLNQQRGIRVAALLVCLAVVIGVWQFGPDYYTWALGGERVAVVVFCDTAGLDKPDLKVVVLYDALALSPLAHMLGIYQNRPAERVRRYYPVPVSRFKLTPFALVLESVPAGPLARITISTGGKWFYAPVKDRLPKNGTIYVRCE